MKIPVQWLGEYVDLRNISDVQLSDALTLSGTENEILKEADFPGVVVGEILEIEKHSNADKLRVTKTDVGKKNGGTLQIVCGAPNIEVGQKVSVALIGAELGEFQIKEAEIRGVKSFGMICSESELGISDEHNGIMVLDPRVKSGTPLGEALNVDGTVIEAELTPNRSDCFSMIGIAREAAASLSRKMKGLNFSKKEVHSNKKVLVEVKDEELCPRYIVKVIEGIKIGPSPKWMQERLSSAGIRPINNVVDVTNYVMLEWGQPLHAFDFEKISSVQIQNSKPKIQKIVVRRAEKGETLETLDGVERKLTQSDLVIADSKKVVALAGVMGGANSEIDEKTTTIVLEAAVFNGTSVRKTAQKFGLRTEASNRFEKGIPLKLPEVAIERAAQLLSEISDNSRVGENVDVLSAWSWVQHVGLDSTKISDFLGIKVERSRVLEILHSLGFEANDFDIKKEARKHVGKPYVFGAKFRTHGDMAFDCSYLTDYIYSQIGQFIGHTSLAQFELGTTVLEEELLPGDILFVKGHIDKSVTDHYFVLNENGNHEKVILSKPKEVGHNGVYIGNGRVVHARHFEYDQKSKKWKKLPKGEVVEESIAVFTENPEYLGARRYLNNLDNFIAITVPWWRLDIKIKEDIFEEIGRVLGYNNLPAVLPSGNLPISEESQKQKISKDIKTTLVGAGFAEVYNYSFVSGKTITATGGKIDQTLKLANPISPELEYMRTQLAGSILKNLATNQDNFEEIKIFEVASVYVPERNSLPKETPHLCLGVRSATKKPGQSFYDLIGALDLIFEKLNLKEVSYRKKDGFIFKKAQSLDVLVREEMVGSIGIISEKTNNDFGLKAEVAVAEININALIDYCGQARQFKKIPKFPLSIRDINILIKESISIAEIRDLVEGLKLDYLKKSEIRDIYVGKGLPENHKSVTIRLVFGSDKKTLKEEEILAIQNKIIQKVEKSFGGKIRS